MPSPKQSSPGSGQRKPGDKFFATVILVGAAILIGIWLKEKPAENKPKPKPTSQPVGKKSVKAEPVSVLVITKTNQTSDQATNVIVFSQTKAQVVAPIATTNSSRPVHVSFAPRPVKSVFEAQLALARRGISAGSIDGVIGSQTRAALRAFQEAERLPITGEVDANTKAKLLLTGPPYTEFFVTTNEFARLQPLGTNWWSKAQQNRLDYENLLELVAEKFGCHPNYLRQINPSVDWTNATPKKVLVPNLERPKPSSTAAFIRVRLSEKTLRAFDGETNLLAHYPCSIAQRIEKRPVGALRIVTIAENPDYTFNPENFPESEEARRLKTKLILSPGPNNPVGTVWIGLDKPGYGIHGTPNPEAVGRTESHGCFRLANWNAEHLVRMISIGTPVFVEP